MRSRSPAVSSGGRRRPPTRRHGTRLMRSAYAATVGNRFTATGTTAAAGDNLKMSNGSTDVFLDVLTLAGSAEAATAWQQNLVLHLADSHRFGRGDAGFDLTDLPWTTDWPAEHAFLLGVIDRALTGHRWDQLGYQPPHVTEQLRIYRAMVAGFTPTPAPRSPFGNWTIPAPRDETNRCPDHQLLVGQAGCRLCSP